MDLTPTEEQEEFRQLARDFLEAEAIPHRQEWDRDQPPPHALTMQPRIRGAQR